MALLRTLFGCHRARQAPPSPAPAPQRRYLPDVPSLLPNDPAEDVTDEESLREWVSLWLMHGQEWEARRCYEEVRALAAQQEGTVPRGSR
ncbi:MAG: hypothetical protein IMW89_17315 [Ktedonobacteraceae bacterium]|jgi:hypothetical protein|nr:hypothetical protein [Ktedonobacteraceae bacterium]